MTKTTLMYGGVVATLGICSAGEAGWFAGTGLVIVGMWIAMAGVNARVPEPRTMDEDERQRGIDLARTMHDN